MCDIFNTLYLVLLYKVPSEHLSSGKKQGASTIKQTEPLSLEDFHKRKRRLIDRQDLSTKLEESEQNNL